MRLLLIDTCGDVGSLALAENGEVLRERTLPPRTASAQLVSAIREELATLGWALRSVSAVAVVNGPGSFTGMRVGLAAAKGLCEVAGLALETVSRLEVLLAAAQAPAGDLAVLDAGRDQFYVRTRESDREELLRRNELAQRAVHGTVFISEEKLQDALQPLRTIMVPLSAACALPLIELSMPVGGESVEAADANYVRHASGLYRARPDALPARTDT